MHIVDISHKGFEEQIQIVSQTLEEIKAADKKTIYVFNKIDAFSYVEKDADDLTKRTKENVSLEEWKNSWRHTYSYDSNGSKIISSLYKLSDCSLAFRSNLIC